MSLEHQKERVPMRHMTGSAARSVPATTALPPRDLKSLRNNAYQGTNVKVAKQINRQLTATENDFFPPGSIGDHHLQSRSSGFKLGSAMNQRTMPTLVRPYANSILSSLFSSPDHKYINLIHSKARIINSEIVMSLQGMVGLDSCIFVASLLRPGLLHCTCDDI